MPQYVKLNSVVDYYKFKRKAEWLGLFPKIKVEVNDRWIKAMNNKEYLKLVGCIVNDKMWNVDLIDPIPLKGVITMDQFIRMEYLQKDVICEYDKLKLL